MEIKQGDIVIVNGSVESYLHEPSPAFRNYPKEILNNVLPEKLNGKEAPDKCYRLLNIFPAAEGKVLVLGRTHRKVGWVHKGYRTYNPEDGYEWQQGSMTVEEIFEVWMVVAINNANRYYKPFAVLPQQIVSVVRE